MKIDLTKVAASSAFQGLQDKGVVSGNGAYPATAIAASFGTGPVIDTAIFMSQSNLMPLLRVQLGGLATNVSDYWYPINAATIVASGVFRIYIFSIGTANGRILRTVVINTAASIQTFPGCTITIQGRAYAYPWK